MSTGSQPPHPTQALTWRDSYWHPWGGLVLVCCSLYRKILPRSPCDTLCCNRARLVLPYFCLGSPPVLMAGVGPSGIVCVGMVNVHHHFPEVLKKGVQNPLHKG